jgi:hypothetical protein
MAVDVFVGINVPQVDQDWASHSPLHLLEVEGVKLLPSSVAELWCRLEDACSPYQRQGEGNRTSERASQ